MFLAAANLLELLMTNFRYVFLCIGSVGFIASGISQSYYYGGQSVNGSVLYSNYQDELHCADCHILGHGPLMIDYSGGMSFGPDDSLYVIDNYPEVSIYQLNTATAAETFIMQGPPNLVKMGGFFAQGGGIFYSVAYPQANDFHLYKWDVGANTFTIVGTLNYLPNGDLWQSNGEVYYASSSNNELRFVKINFDDPSNSEVVFTLSAAYSMFGLSPTYIGNIWIGFDRSYFGGVYMVTVNTTDGTVTPKCKLTKSSGSHNSRYLTSIYEHRYNPLWNYLDIDCDDSSLATESDFNALPFDCFTEGGIPITDSDIKTIMDEVITSMTIHIVDPPDGADEILLSTGDVDKIHVSGSATSEMVLTNDGGAKIGDFEAALRLIRYDNLAWHLTPGIRNIEVQFETEIGTESNVATAFLEVVERPQVAVDLGDDLTFCPGETVQLTAGSGQNMYEWSTGETSESIEVSSEGTYSVTVTHALQCPNFDEIEIVELPEYYVSLTGDSSICANQVADLTLHTDANFPIDVEVYIGNQSNWYTITNHVLTFTDIPIGNTVYYINAIVPSEEACMISEDYDQSIEVFPAYQTESSTSICQGDSIHIGNTWLMLPGDYPISLQSIHGCDSLVTLHLSVAPVIEIAVQETTCDSSAAGIFYQTLINPTGCDTLITTTITYQSADTTFATALSCRQSEVGTSTQTYTSIAGCDSLVITQITWDPPADTTRIFLTSCDSASWGIFAQLLNGVDGCDSMVMAEVVSGQPISINLQVTSCDSASLGIFENHFTGVMHCDSTVITTVMYSAQDSTFITSTSCDQAAAGVYYHPFINQFGCDSIVSETVIVLPVQTTELFSTTCDSTASGDFTSHLINQYGCDSMVVSHVGLLPTQHVLITETTCHSSEAGVFEMVFANQFGCDSLITRIVTSIPADTTLISRQTCFQDSTGIESSVLTNQDGCDSLLISTTTLFTLPEIMLDVSDLFHGYEISCFGNQDGYVEAVVQGIAPFDLQWSNGSKESLIHDLAEGKYSIRVIDANGCMATDSIELHSPEAITLTLDVHQPTCDEPNLGQVDIHASGGAGSLNYSLDGVNYGASSHFDVAAPATYLGMVMDENGCEASEMFVLDASNDLAVTLGEDRVVLPGTSVTLEAMFNLPADSITSISWAGGPFTSCLFCFYIDATPLSTSYYSVSIESKDGCVARDTVWLIMETQPGLDIPNIISPNGDGINDRFVLSSAADVAHFELVEIFDRWGNIIFSAKDVLPNDAARAWDGTRKGEVLDPAVFTYRIIYTSLAAEQVVRVGDVTLIR